MTTIIHQRVEEARAGKNPRVIARMASGWAVIGDTQFLPGYCLLLPDPVVGSLNDLSGQERRLYLSDMAVLGDAVMRAMKPSPRRVNYEMLGNLEPALHAHVLPRYESEPPEFRTRSAFGYPDEYWKGTRWAFDVGRPEHARTLAAIAAELKLLSAQRCSGPGHGDGARWNVDGCLWQHAAAFASRAHAGHVRKDGVTPYISHPFRVAMTVRDVFGCDDQVALAAALLHDTIEDTRTDYDDLLGDFGREVADCVAALSKDKRIEESLREQLYDQQIAAAPWQARLVKLADVLDNFCDLPNNRGGSREEQVKKCIRSIEIARPVANDHACVARAIEVVRSFAGLVG